MQTRSGKQKGSQFEYSCRDSLLPVIPDILLTKQLGFVSGYDLESHSRKEIWECKRHKGFNWNELIKWFKNLEKKAPPEYKGFLFFKANHQPCLMIFRQCFNNQLCITEFEGFYNTPFIEHKGKKKNEN